MLVWKCMVLVYRLWGVLRSENKDTVCKLRSAAIDCGACGIKFLQFLAMNDGVLSNVYKSELYDVLENCEVHDWDHTVVAYQLAFGRSIYDDFDINEHDTPPSPIGSGSIGQVYKLFDRQTAKNVALKAKHPGITQNVNDFVDTLHWVSSWCSWMPFRFIIEEFIHNVQLQLDYEAEAQHLQDMPFYEGIIVPDVIRAKEDIIVMTYHNGVSFLDVKDKKIRLKVATNILLFMISCLICDNFIHCDMHYGNWKVVLETGDIIVYDCGLIATLGGPDEADLKAFMLGVLNGDIKRVAYAVCEDLENDPLRDTVIERIDKLIAQPFDKDTDRLSAFLRMLLRSGIKLDSSVLRCFQGMLICLSTFIESKDGLMRYLDGRSDNFMDIFLCVMTGILERTGKFPGVHEQFKEWIKSDISIEGRFTLWMNDMYGHCDKEVLFEVLEKLDIV